jgi:small multidrug resistance family-3 protein
MTKAALIYIGAALAEIAGCFSFWMWLRASKPFGWLLPGMISLALFAWLLTWSIAPQPGAPTPPMAAFTSAPR